MVMRNIHRHRDGKNGSCFVSNVAASFQRIPCASIYRDTPRVFYAAACCDTCTGTATLCAPSPPEFDGITAK